MQEIPYFINRTIGQTYHNKKWESGVFLTNLRTLLRLILRQRVLTSINIFGLATGIAVATMIFLWAQAEFAYDSFHDRGDRIYRVVTDYPELGKRFSSPGLLGPAALEEVPEIVNFARFRRWKTATVAAGGTCFYEDDIIIADASLFEMLSFPFVSGDVGRALSSPYQIAMSQSMARKYFGNQNPVGRVLTVDNSTALTVSGVFADIPENSHLAFDFVCPMEICPALGMTLVDWGSDNFGTYLEVSQNARPEKIDSALAAVGLQHNVLRTGEGKTWFVQPLADIHLDGSVISNSSKRIDIEDKRRIYAFSWFAAAVLLLACINFTNLSTAQAARRAREIGIRKTLGAARTSLMMRFLGESLFLAAIGGMVAMVMLEYGQTLFNQIMHERLVLDWFNLRTVLTICAVVLTAGLAAGIYPAFYLSRFMPGQILKSGTITLGKSGLLRRLLVLVQLVVSTGLIIGASTISQQLEFTAGTRSGFDSNNIIYVPTRDNVRSDYAYFKNRLSQHPDVLAVTEKDCLPTRHINRTTGCSWEDKDPQNNTAFETIRIGPDYFRTLGMSIVAGSDFPQGGAETGRTLFILNEEAVRRTGLESPVGEPFALYNDEGIIVGVVGDAHFKTFRRGVEPQVFSLITDMEQVGSRGVVLIKTSGQNNAEVISSIEELWREINPTTPLQFGFLDDAMREVYADDEALLSLIVGMAGLAILISCLGLYALCVLLTEQRTKEIGVRKVLGATVIDILRLLSKEMLWLVLVANLIAWPLAWFFVGRWLEDFVYRANSNPLTYLTAGLIVLTLAVASISVQSIRASMARPVKALKYE
jgi:predicted permease